MGDLYKHDRLMQASWNVVDMFVQCMFFFLLSKRSGSSDTCVAGDTMLDGPALVKLALQVEPRRPRRQALSTQNKSMQLGIRSTKYCQHQENVSNLDRKIKSCGDGVV